MALTKRVLVRRLRRFAGSTLNRLALLDHITAKRGSMLVNPPIQIDVEQRKICIYVSFNEILDDVYTRSLLNEIRSEGFQILHVVNQKVYSPLEGITTDQVLLRKNYGFDLAAIKDALDLFKGEPVELLIMNSSVVYFPGTFQKLLRNATMSKSDVVAMVNSYQKTYHFQSFFFYSRSHLGITTLFDTYRKMRNWRTKRGTVSFGEFSIYPSISLRGCTSEPLFSFDSLIEKAQLSSRVMNLTLLEDLTVQDVNPTQHLWRQLLNSGAPFVKRNLIHSNPAGLEDVPLSVEDAHDIYLKNIPTLQ